MRPFKAVSDQLRIPRHPPYHHRPLRWFYPRPADACGITYNAMYYTMSGKCIVSDQRKKIIANVLGIPPEEAFQREEDD